MARVSFGEGGIFSYHGRISKKDKRSGYYFTERLSTPLIVKAKWDLKDPSVAQLAVREKFVNAWAKVKLDAANPEKIEEWRAVAEASNGKYKTWRGAAFASYYAQGGGE